METARTTTRKRVFLVDDDLWGWLKHHAKRELDRPTAGLVRSILRDYRREVESSKREVTA
jgi:hypothetical protein